MNLYELVREDDGRVNLRVSKVINPDVSDVPDISMSEYILTCFPHMTPPQLIVLFKHNTALLPKRYRNFTK